MSDAAVTAEKSQHDGTKNESWSGQDEGLTTDEVFVVLRRRPEHMKGKPNESVA